MIVYCIWKGYEQAHLTSLPLPLLVMLIYSSTHAFMHVTGARSIVHMDLANIHVLGNNKDPNLLLSSTALSDITTSEGLCLVQWRVTEGLGDTTLTTAVQYKCRQTCRYSMATMTGREEMENGE